MSDANIQSCGASVLGDSAVTPEILLLARGKPLIPRVAQSRYIHPPRLGIIHLLAWITVTAVLLKIDNYIASDRQFELNAWLWLKIVENILTGAGLVGIGILALTKLRQKESFLQPGHWLVLLVCMKIFVKKFTIINAMSYSTLDLSLLNYELVSYGFGWAIIESIVLYWFAVKIPESGRWRIFFRVWASAIIVSILVKCGQEIIAIGPQLSLLLPVLCLLINLVYIFQFVYDRWTPIFIDTINVPLFLLPMPVVLDVINGFRRDWVHWLGVSMVFLEFASIPIQVLID